MNATGLSKALKMTDTEQYKTALGKAMTLCSKREYCFEDIRIKLEQWGLNSGDSNKILNTLARENFINEIRYAEAYARDKFRYNKWGKIKIFAMLRSRKIPADIISSALNSIDDKQYIDTISDLLKNHRRTIKAKNQYDLKAKLLRFGLSKGFERNILYDLIGED